MDQRKKVPLLEVRDLRTSFKTDEGTVHAVDGVSLHVNSNETLAIVGESGSGKTVTLLSILRLIEASSGSVDFGEIVFNSRNLLMLSYAEMREVRGNEIAMIFQEPMTSLNPVFTVGHQITEVICLHQKVKRQEAHHRAIEMLRMVGIPDPERRIRDYPHQMSGGMRQRVMIAIALSCNPKLLLADEPTTALDATVEAQILDLVLKLKRDFGMAVVWVTHDLGVVAEIAQRTAVMYAGKIVEEADVESIFYEPLHPYMEGLLQSIPRVDKNVEQLHVIEGTVPNPTSFPKGCRFHPRCGRAIDQCQKREPALREVRPGHFVACHLV